MNKSTIHLKTGRFIKSSIRETLKKKNSITIIELCEVIIDSIDFAITLYKDVAPIPLPEDEITLLSHYKWSAQKVINKHDRFNETGQRGYYLNHFNNLRDLLELVEGDWALLMFEGDVKNLPESVMKAFEDVSIETKIKSIIAQDIEPQPKENQTH